MATGEDLDRVRSELRRLGYLDHGFERFLLQDALRPRAPLGTVVRLTLRVALLAGGVVAAALALALVAANGGFSAAPLDAAVLFLHLFPPISAAAGLGFLALCGLVLLVLRVYHVRRIEAVSLAVAAAVGVSALALVVWGVQELVHEGQRPLLIVLGVAAPVAVTVLVRLVYQGLLTLAIRFTDSAPPRGSLFSRRGVGLAILAAAFLVTVPAVFSARRELPPPPPSLPMAPGDRVLLLGIDGVLPEEVDYLLAVGDLPTLGRLAREGGGIWRYRRDAEPPASFWTAVATGIPGPDHGVNSLDSFRPLGVETPLARNGPLRLWWSRVEVPLGLAEYRAVLANRRRAFAVWELASRGGGPVLAVNWWGTFPAEPLPGLVVAHGAYQLLEEGAQGAIAPDREKNGAEMFVRGTRDNKGERCWGVSPPRSLLPPRLQCGSGPSCRIFSTGGSSRPGSPLPRDCRGRRPSTCPGWTSPRTGGGEGMSPLPIWFAPSFGHRPAVGRGSAGSRYRGGGGGPRTAPGGERRARADLAPCRVRWPSGRAGNARDRTRGRGFGPPPGAGPAAEPGAAAAAGRLPMAAAPRGPPRIRGAAAAAEPGSRGGGSISKASDRWGTFELFGGGGGLMVPC